MISLTFPHRRFTWFRKSTASISLRPLPTRSRALSYGISYHVRKYGVSPRISTVRASDASTAAPLPAKQSSPWQGAALKPLATTIATGVILWFIPAPSGVSRNAWQLLAIFLATIVGIITQPLPLSAVALLGLGATVLTKTLTSAAAFSAFGDQFPGSLHLEKMGPMTKNEVIMAVTLLVIQNEHIQNTAGTAEGFGDGAACGVFEEYVVEAIDSATSSICSDVVTEAGDDLRVAMEFGEYGLFALKMGGRGDWGRFDVMYAFLTRKLRSRDT